MLHEKHNNKVTVRLTDEIFETIKLYSEFNNISFSKAVEMVLERGMMNNENPYRN